MKTKYIHGLSFFPISGGVGNHHYKRIILPLTLVSLLPACQTCRQFQSFSLPYLSHLHHYIVLIKIAEFLTPSTNNEGRKHGKK